MKNNIKVLAIDDDKSWLSQIPIILEDYNYDITLESSIDEALAKIDNNFYDIILLDINFNDDPRNGIDLFRVIKSKDHSVDVIVISGETNPSRLVEIFNAGVTKFLPKPCKVDQIRSAISDALLIRQMRHKAQFYNECKDESLIGKSEAMRKLREEVAYVVKAGIKDILLVGETGTGKELVASAIAHLADPHKRFIPIHCGAITDGLAESELFGHMRGSFTGADKDRQSVFEIAGGGFVFFDEIGDMPPIQQAKLLRVLQERQVQRVGSSKIIPVNFRSISATHVNLEHAIIEKKFREDLYYRIAKHVITVPALRDRIEDIKELSYYFLANLFPNRPIVITNEAIDLLKSYHWPGNVRQLKATIESIGSRVESGTIKESDICQALPQISNVFTSRTSRIMIGRYGASIISKEKERFENAIRASKGNKKKAAEVLGVSRATFYRRASELGLVAKSF